MAGKRSGLLKDASISAPECAVMEEHLSAGPGFPGRGVSDRLLIGSREVDQDFGRSRGWRQPLTGR